MKYFIIQDNTTKGYDYIRRYDTKTGYSYALCDNAWVLCIGRMDEIIKEIEEQDDKTIIYLKEDDAFLEII